MTRVPFLAAAAALALVAPAARADTVLSAACHIHATSATYASWSGTVAGSAAATSPGSGWLDCGVVVNGVAVTSTPPTHFTGGGASSGPVAFTAGPTDVVDICVHIAFDDGHTYFSCGGTTVTGSGPYVLTG